MRYLITFCCLVCFLFVGNQMSAQSCTKAKKATCTAAQKAKCSKSNASTEASFENPVQMVKAAETTQAATDRAAQAQAVKVTDAKKTCSPSQMAGKKCDPTKCTPAEKAACEAKMKKASQTAITPKAKAKKVSM